MGVGGLVLEGVVGGLASAECFEFPVRVVGDRPVRLRCHDPLGAGLVDQRHVQRISVGIGVVREHGDVLGMRLVGCDGVVVRDGCAVVGWTPLQQHPELELVARGGAIYPAQRPVALGGAEVRLDPAGQAGGPGVGVGGRFALRRAIDAEEHPADVVEMGRRG